MEGIIKDDTIIIPYLPKYERRGFGRRRGDNIILRTVEAVYLALKGDLSVSDHKSDRYLNLHELFEWGVQNTKNFPVYFFAYEDLRERGNKIKLEGEYISVIGRSTKTFIPISERESICFPELYKIIERINANGGDNVILAVVDEESDVIYYRVSIMDKNLKGEQKEDINHITGYFMKDRVITQERSIFQNLFYGEEKNNLVGLSLIESLYLVRNGKLTVYSEHDEIYNEENLLKRGIETERDFKDRFKVYEDLKGRGFVAKTGFKFGSDFRLYNKVEKVKDLPHSKYLVSVTKKKETPMAEISRAVRLAQNVRKKMIFGFVSEDGKSRYILIEWIKI